nr:hypothetical protein [Tanacetum cinerariifolium]
ISADAENKVLTFLPRLKTLDLYNIDFSSVVTSCVIELICGYRNLESHSIRIIDEYAVRVPAVCSSPKMDIYADSSGVRELGGDNGERKFATKLLKLRRASPLAKVDIVWR